MNKDPGIYIPQEFGTKDWSGSMPCKPAIHINDLVSLGPEKWAEYIGNVNSSNFDIVSTIMTTKAKQLAETEEQKIVQLFKEAAETILNFNITRMSDYRGKLITVHKPIFGVGLKKMYMVFPMLHPAYLLHSQGDIKKYELAREQTWQDIQYIKAFCDKENL